MLSSVLTRFSNKNNTEDLIYREFTNIERLQFKKIMSALCNTILTMIKNGVVVLPSDLKENAKRTPYKHIQINTIDKKEALKRYKYDKMASFKDIVLNCFPNKENQVFLEHAIKKITFIKNNIFPNSRRIKFIFNKDIVQQMHPKKRYFLIRDVLFFEKIINDNNTKFIKLLPYAIKQRGKIKEKLINRTKVPKKAIYQMNDGAFLLQEEL